MRDPGLDEIRQARHEISEECGHDLHRVVAFYRKVEEELRRTGRHQFEEMTPTPPLVSDRKSRADRPRV